jgi:2-polyprenyl-6-hydroxyphenyl methylase/3-demethylubiquinone-9 3-methyltransferase
MTTSTAAPDEIARFSAMAEAWWDPTGSFKPLHRFNPVRLGFLRSRLVGHFERDPKALSPFTGLRLLDIGCGGGLLAEPLTRMGFAVTGIDAAEKNIAIARLHAEGAGLAVDYRVASPEMLAAESYDVVLAMEVVEHVADAALFMAEAARLVRPGGVLVAATLNRTPQAFALGIVGAEYLLRWVPRGTHDWRKFVTPAELAGHFRRNGLLLKEIRGFSFSPLKDEWTESADLSVNYAAWAIK